MNKQESDQLVFNLQIPLIMGIVQFVASVFAAHRLDGGAKFLFAGLAVTHAAGIVGLVAGQSLAVANSKAAANKKVTSGTRDFLTAPGRF